MRITVKLTRAENTALLGAGRAFAAHIGQTAYEEGV